MDTVKNKGGRPRKAPDDLLEQRSIRLSKDNWKKIEENGGLPALRKLIDRWKPKPNA